MIVIVVALAASPDAAPLFAPPFVMTEVKSLTGVGFEGSEVTAGEFEVAAWLLAVVGAACCETGATEVCMTVAGEFDECAPRELKEGVDDNPGCATKTCQR